MRGLCAETDEALTRAVQQRVAALHVSYSEPRTLMLVSNWTSALHTVPNYGLAQGLVSVKLAPPAPTYYYQQPSDQTIHIHPTV